MAVGRSGGSAQLAYFPEEANPVLAGFERTPTAALDNPEQRAADAGGLLLGQQPMASTER